MHYGAAAELFPKLILYIVNGIVRNKYIHTGIDLCVQRYHQPTRTVVVHNKVVCAYYLLMRVDYPHDLFYKLGIRFLA